MTRRGFAGLGTMLLLAAACDQPTDPAVRVPDLRISAALIADPGGPYAQGERIVVCKQGGSGSYDFTVAGTDLDDASPINQQFSLLPGQCWDVGFFGGAGANVSITEEPRLDPGHAVVSITVDQLVGADQNIPGPTNTVSNVLARGLAPATAAYVVFTNSYTPPSNGCTHTIGWFQNAGASNVPGGQFDNSGKTYAQVLATDPDGNHYYIVARQYIAAFLNIQLGADGTSIQATLAAVAAYFAEAGPGDPLDKNDGGVTYTKDQLSGWATILDEFNRGVRGPGKCTN
jgi:hypothetical protein